MIETALTDIHSARLSPLVPQESSYNLLQKGLTKALAVKSGKTSAAEVYYLSKKVSFKFRMFGTTDSEIFHRYLTVWAHDYDKKSERMSLVENGEFVEYDFGFPMYEELAKRHVNPEGSDLKDRMALYRSQSEAHIGNLYEQTVEKPDHIVHVTSTGFLDPNPVDAVMASKQWYDVDVTTFYHRACNAPISAIRTANALLTASLAGGCETPKKRIDLVHSEIFSVHTRIAEDDPVNIALMCKFSDSFLRYAIESCDDIRKKGKSGLKILAFKNFTVPDTSAIAQWSASNPCFEFKVDALNYFKLVKTHVRQFTHAFFAEHGMDFAEVKGKTVFALQASSLSILNEIGQELKLSKELKELSRKTLYENGYLSSGAIPFMCKQIIESSDIPSGALVFCLGYGQGVTMSGMLLEKM